MASENGAKILNFAPKTESPSPENTVHEAVTAFLVIINKDGSIMSVPDVNYAQYLDLDRPPHPDEVQAAAQVVAQDILVRRTAGTVQSVMAALGRQAMEAQATMMESQAAQQMVTQLGDLTRTRQ
jgi:hypothetical protein